MKAVIIAGGKGRRMGKLSGEIPKSMIFFAGKPIIQHQIELLARYGIIDATVITCHLSKAIEDFLGDGSRFGVKISYYREERSLGTTGGLKEIEGQLTEEFLVIYGDVMLDMDFSRLIAFHRGHGGAATLVVHPNDHPLDSDLVEIVGDGRIVVFHPKPHEENHFYHNMVSAGVYVLSPQILAHIPRGVKSDFGRRIFPSIVTQEELYGYNTPEYVKDIGTPERTKEVRSDVENGKVARLNLVNERPAIFLDRDGVINRSTGLLKRAEDFELLPGVAEAVCAINRSEYLAVVITNQPVIARNLCTLEGLDEIHKKMETLLGRAGAKFDAIKFCPHHPDRGYPGENPVYKIDCDCRKPKPGMVFEAAEEFHIDLTRSFLIGDAERDIICGKNAGVRTVVLTSGAEYDTVVTEPDYRCRDLGEAVAFILEESQR